MAVNLADSAGPVREKRAVKGNGERGALWEVESPLRLPRAAGPWAGGWATTTPSRHCGGALPPRGGASCSPAPPAGAEPREGRDTALPARGRGTARPGARPFGLGAGGRWGSGNGRSRRLCWGERREGFVSAV